MEIGKHKHVTIDYTLSDENGNVLDSSKESGSLSYIHGVGTLVSGLESALEGKSEGDKFSVKIPPEKGYGDPDDSLIYDLPLERFSEIEDLKPGISVHVNDERFNRIMRVIEVNEDTVTLDGNHPLAGMNLDIDVEVLVIRDATTAELEQLYAQPSDCSSCGGSCDSC